MSQVHKLNLLPRVNDVRKLMTLFKKVCKKHFEQING